MIDDSLIRNVQRYREQNPNAGRKTVAKYFGISLNQARAILRRLGVRDCAKKMLVADGASLEEDLQAARLELREAEAKRATDRYKSLLKRAVIEEDIVEEFGATAKEALAEGRLNIVIPPAPLVAKGGGSEEEAVLVISDSHVGKLVGPEHTLGFGHYNPRIFLNRLAYMEETVFRLLRENVGSLWAVVRWNRPANNIKFAFTVRASFGLAKEMRH